MHSLAPPPRINQSLRGDRTTPRLFVPGLYEYRSRLVDSTPARTARDARALARACAEDASRIGTEILTASVDVYNIEAEACGARVRFHEDAPLDTPQVDGSRPVIGEDTDLSSLDVPDPAVHGRGAAMIQATACAAKAVGGQAWVVGAVTGPFTLANQLAGMENLFEWLLVEPELASQVLAFAEKVSARFLDAYLQRGLGVTVFDSNASPALISPAQFDTFAREPLARLVARARAAGQEHVPLVIGGNTLPILGALVKTGANYLLCDDLAHAPAFVEGAARAGRAVRVNIPASVIAAGPGAISSAVERVAGDLAGYDNWFWGSGVVGPDVPEENLVAFRELARAADAQPVETRSP